MKQSFLDSLHGLTVKEASALVTNNGHNVRLLKVGAIVPALAVPNTVLLFGEESESGDDIVVYVESGDPLQVENDVELNQSSSNYAAKLLALFIAVGSGSLIGHIFGVLPAILGATIGLFLALGLMGLTPDPDA